MNQNKDLILRERLALQRTILANQSTFLSFIRTSMYFLVAGLSIKQFITATYSEWVEVMFFMIAGIVLLLGILNYRLQLKKIYDSEIHIGDYKDDYTGKK